MEHDELQKLIYRILTTEDEEIDCEQTFDLIARYVDLEISGADARQLLPLVSQHLSQCDGCHELYETLREIALLEEEGELPDIDVLISEITAAEPEPQAADSPGESNRVQPSGAPVVLEDSASVRPGEQHVEKNSQPISNRFEKPRRRRQPPLWQRWSGGLAWATAAIALFIALAAGVWAWGQSGQSQHLAFIANADWVIRLKGTDQASNARGFVFVDTAHQRALILCKGLKPLPQDQVYQVWIQQDDQVLSGGTFRVQADARETLFYVSFDKPLSPEAKFMVTKEPHGGSLKPTSLAVLQGARDY